MEYWSDGIIENWSIGVAECWSIGIMQFETGQILEPLAFDPMAGSVGKAQRCGQKRDFLI